MSFSISVCICTFPSELSDLLRSHVFPSTVHIHALWFSRNATNVLSLRAMFAHCSGPIWQRDDLSLCFEIEYVTFHPPLFTTAPAAFRCGRASVLLHPIGPSTLIEVLQFPSDPLSVDRLQSFLPYPSIPSLSTMDSVSNNLDRQMAASQPRSAARTCQCNRSMEMSRFG